MTDQQKMIAGAVLGIALIAAAIYYFFYKGKSGKTAFGAQGASKPTSGKVGGGSSASSAQQAPQVVYVPATAGTVDANIVARWLTYSPTMKAIQQNLKDTCAVGKNITVDGYLGNETLNAIKGFQSSYGQQIAREIESTKYITKAQADWLLKPCGAGSTASASGTSSSTASGSGITLSNYRTASLAQRNAFTYNILGTKAGSWTESQMFEWLYAYLKGAGFFYCNNCSWGYRGYYSTKDLQSFGALSNLPAGAKYVNSENGTVFVK